MDKHYLYIDGERNDDYGVVLQGALRLSAPVPKVTTISVPGRNGDLHIFDGSFKNITAKVDAYVLDTNRNVKSIIPRVNEWLCLGKGYMSISTDDDPKHFLLGRVKNGAEINARLNILAPFTIEFDCKPQRFLRDYYSSDIEVGSGDEIENPTQYTAYPIYTIFSSGGEGSLTVGGNTVYFSNMPEWFEYDAETQNAYRGSTNLNPHTIGINGLPLLSGTQTITYSGGIDAVSIRARFFEI